MGNNNERWVLCYVRCENFITIIEKQDFDKFNKNTRDCPFLDYDILVLQLGKDIYGNTDDCSFLISYLPFSTMMFKPLKKTPKGQE